MPDLLDQITHPSKCFIGVSIPLTIDDLDRDLRAGDNKDFVKVLKPKKINKTGEEIWKAGYGQLMTNFHKHLREIESMNVCIKLGFSLDDMAKISGFDAFTILTHSNQTLEKIELADGLHTAKKLTSHIPNAFRGFIDLTACYSTFIQPVIKKARPDCLVIANEDLTSLQLRIIFYKYIIKLLHKEPMNYLDAFQKIRLMLLE